MRTFSNIAGKEEHFFASSQPKDAQQLGWLNQGNLTFSRTCRDPSYKEWEKGLTHASLSQMVAIAPHLGIPQYRYRVCATDTPVGVRSAIPPTDPGMAPRSGGEFLSAGTSQFRWAIPSRFFGCFGSRRGRFPLPQFPQDPNV